MKFASLCILAYKRPQLLEQCIKSILATVDYPCEIIINFDGLDGVYDFTPEGFVKCSKQILVYGKNRGVGRSLGNCLGLAEGDYIFKIDADLTFSPKWLSSAVKILDADEKIGAVGLFDYNKWDPNDERFKPEKNIINHATVREEALIIPYQRVEDFVSSIYGFRAKDKNKFDGNDDGFHYYLKWMYGQLALKDSVVNTAFGVGKSTYVTGTMDHPVKTPTHPEPLLFGMETASQG